MNTRGNKSSSVYSRFGVPLRFQYEAGGRAFSGGYIENPYKEGTNQWREWQRGFDAMYFTNLEEVQARESGGS